MSDTPRTDEAQFGTGRVSVSFARTLERELNAANQRIKRLEEAGNEMHRYITVTRGLLPECTNDWRKAKEAKP